MSNKKKFKLHKKVQYQESVNDLKKDIGETQNLLLTDQYSTIESALKNELHTILLQNKAPIPQLK